MTLRTYIRQQKRTLQAISEKYLTDDALDNVTVEPDFWAEMHGDGDVLDAAGRLPEHRRMSAFWVKNIVNAPEQLRNIAEEIVLLHEIGHCRPTSDSEIDASAWARKHATRRRKQYIDELAPRALATYARPERDRRATLCDCYVEYCMATRSVP